MVQDMRVKGEKVQLDNVVDVVANNFNEVLQSFDGGKYVVGKDPLGLLGNIGRRCDFFIVDQKYANADPIELVAAENARRSPMARQIAEALGGLTPEVKDLFDANPPIQVYVADEKRIVFKVGKGDQAGSLIAQSYEKAHAKKGEDLVKIVDNRADLESALNEALSDAESDFPGMVDYFKQLPSVYFFVSVPKQRHVVTGKEDSKEVVYTGGAQYCVEVKDPRVKGESPVFKIAGNDQIVCVNYESFKSQTVSEFEDYLLKVQESLVKPKSRKKKHNPE